jgi:diadenosine tetraphosphatase ApaH/serine/threonine PP2A family protein phosphatase
MRTAVLADVHANLEALEAVLAEAAADRLVVLGDIVGYNADPDAVVRLLVAEGATMIAGNHDLAATERFDLAWFNEVAAGAIRWTRDVASPDTLRMLRTLEPSATLDERLLVHGSVVDPAAEYLRNADQARASFAAADFAAAFYGHTHVPAAFAYDGGRVRELAAGEGVEIALRDGVRYLLNPGSAGQPRDGDPRASYAVVEDGTIRWRRVAYDIAATQKKIRSAGLSVVLAERLAIGR